MANINKSKQKQKLIEDYKNAISNILQKMKN